MVDVVILYNCIVVHYDHDWLAATDHLYVAGIKQSVEIKLDPAAGGQR